MLCRASCSSTHRMFVFQVRVEAGPDRWRTCRASHACRRSPRWPWPSPSSELLREDAPKQCGPRSANAQKDSIHPGDARVEDAVRGVVDDALPWRLRLHVHNRRDVLDDGGLLLDLLRHQLKGPACVLFFCQVGGRFHVSTRVQHEQPNSHAKRSRNVNERARTRDLMQDI